MRMSARGLTLPWQLVAAQPPGPTYFPVSLGEPAAGGTAGDGVGAGDPPAANAKDARAAAIKGKATADQPAKADQPERNPSRRIFIRLSENCAGGGVQSARRPSFAYTCGAE